LHKFLQAQAHSEVRVKLSSAQATVLEKSLANETIKIPPGNYRLDNPGPEKLYWRAETKGQSSATDFSEEGIRITRTYQGLDRPQDVHRDGQGIWHIRRGARVCVVLSAVSQGAPHRPRLQDALPGGLEAIRLVGASHDSVAILHESGLEVESRFGDVLSCEYMAQATWPGTYTAPPAYAEDVDHPEFTGQTDSAQVIVE